MISATRLRNGVTFVDKGVPWRVVEYKHTHMSRGSGTVKVKCRNLNTGRTLSKTFNGKDKVEDISVTNKPMQYLYQDGDEYTFMDQKTYEQTAVPANILIKEAKYLQEGDVVSVLFWEEKAISVDLSPKVTFEVGEAAPGERGDSASNVYKDAVMKNGLKVRVPLFINVGDKVRVDTRDGSYVERVKG